MRSGPCWRICEVAICEGLELHVNAGKEEKAWLLRKYNARCCLLRCLLHVCLYACEYSIHGFPSYNSPFLRQLYFQNCFLRNQRFFFVSFQVLNPQRESEDLPEDSHLQYRDKDSLKLYEWYEKHTYDLEQRYHTPSPRLPC